MIFSPSPHQKQGPSLLVANREELNIVDSAKPDPAGFREQVYLKLFVMSLCCAIEINTHRRKHSFDL